MNIYYWNARSNFGDVLSPLIIKRFTRLDVNISSPSKAEIVMVGSILEHLPPDWEGVIAGSGKLHQSSILHLDRAKILALRGPLTAKGIKGDYVLADFGLIANELVALQDKEYELGIVPHWSDKALANNPQFKKYSPKIIDVSLPPLEVITQIAKCKKIVSSSLHGIILADAFSIPRRIEIAPRMVSHPHQEGGLFKWEDYSASINMKLEIGITRAADRNIINEKQDEIFDVLDEIKSIFSNQTSS